MIISALGFFLPSAVDRRPVEARPSFGRAYNCAAPNEARCALFPHYLDPYRRREPPLLCYLCGVPPSKNHNSASPTRLLL